MADPRVIDPTRPDFTPYLPGGGTPVPVSSEVVDQYLRGLVELNAELAERFRREKIDLPFADTATGNTSAAGNATFPILQAAQGWFVSVSSLIVEATTFDASGAVTPAAASNAGWLGIFVTDDPNNVAQGQLADFMPTTAGGQVIPAVAEYGSDTRTGILVRSGEYLVCALRGAVASKRISVNYQAVRWGAES